jgi:hypothetical protein
MKIFLASAVVLLAGSMATSYNANYHLPMIAYQDL